MLEFRALSYTSVDIVRRYVKAQVQVHIAIPAGIRPAIFAEPLQAKQFGTLHELR